MTGTGLTALHAPPLVGDRIVDAEHATVERGLDLPQPSFQRRSLVRILSARASSTPLRISPRTSALRKRSPSRIDPYQAETWGLQRSPLRTSEMMLVSIRLTTNIGRTVARLNGIFWSMRRVGRSAVQNRSAYSGMPAIIVHRIE